MNAKSFLLPTMDLCCGNPIWPYMLVWNPPQLAVFEGAVCLGQLCSCCVANGRLAALLPMTLRRRELIR